MARKRNYTTSAFTLNQSLDTWIAVQSRDFNLSKSDFVRKALSYIARKVPTMIVLQEEVFGESHE